MLHSLALCQTVSAKFPAANPGLTWGKERGSRWVQDTPLLPQVRSETKWKSTKPILSPPRRSPCVISRPQFSQQSIHVSIPVGVPRGRDEHGHGDRDWHWDGDWVGGVVHLHGHGHEGRHADRHQRRRRRNVRLRGPGILIDLTSRLFTLWIENCYVAKSCQLHSS